MENCLGDIVIALLLVVFGGFVTGAAIAVTSARRSKMRSLEEQGSRLARRTLALMEQPERVLTGARALSIIMWLVSSAYAITGCALPLRDWLQESGGPFVASHALTFALAVVIAAVAFVITVVGDLVPRTLASRFSDSLAIASARPLELLLWVVWPFAAIVTATANLLLIPVGGWYHSGRAMTEEDLKGIVEAGEEEGVIEEDEKEMIDSVLEFTDTIVRQVMVPRIDMSFIDARSSVNDLVALILECGHSRIPVCEDNVDNIIGIVHVKDILQMAPTAKARSESLRPLVRPAFFVPENKKVTELLDEFRANKTQLAIVRDEYGGTAGLVTVEDLIEEIVGEIRDEYDKEEPLLAVQEGDGSIVDARMSIDDLNEQLEIDLPTDEFETIGGFVFGQLGKEPEVGDSVDYDGWTFTVEAKEDRRLKRIRIEPRPIREESSEQTAAGK